MVKEAPNLITITETVMALVAFTAIFYVILLYFIGSLRKTLHKVPVSMQTVSRELSWLLLVPIVNACIAWILLPFTTPRALRKALQTEGSVAWAKTQSLARVGFALCLLMLLDAFVLGWIFSLSHSNFKSQNVPQHSLIAAGLFLVLSLADFVVFIVYWVKLIAIRSFLDNASGR